MTKARRGGKVFLDWSQNSGSKTTIAPYSLRGRDVPTVAAPRTWDVLAAGAEDPVGIEHLRFDEVLERDA
jgi:bifunctional non-homologous end joining protein LigD